MSDLEKRFHETWLGMVQPVEGLVVSVPVLVEAQCMARQTPDVQQRLIELAPPTRDESTGPTSFTIRDLDSFLSELLQLSPELFDRGEGLPEELSLYVPEGRQTIRPTRGLRRLDGDTPDEIPEAEATPSSRAGARYVALVWDLADPNIAGDEGIGLDLDKPETKTGPWEYPPTAKLDRLLRHCRVPIGLLTNREVVRLVYAPHGESSGHLTFRLDDMASVGGRPILDAFVMLLSATRFFGVAEEKALPALLKQSRLRQANVTNDLADQVFDALQILLRGFEAAAERDGRSILDDALARDGDHLYKGLLTVLLRLVFLLYAEDRGLLPLEHRHYAEHLSLLGLFERLQHDHGAHPDSMSRRFGAWAHLVALFRTLYLGLEHGDLRLPPRRGALFDPNTYPFLEGWGPEGAAPIVIPEHRAAVRVPTVDDETVFRVLEKLLLFEGQRLSYRTLDVEQIGSVYEALMGFHVVRTTAPAVCLRPSGLWLTPEEALEVPASRRAKWLKETVGLSKAQAEKLAELLKDAKTEDAKLEALATSSITGKKRDPSLARARAGQLVLQPGTERRRTSSHYTPRSLSAPIVRRTLEPLLAAMGDTPRSDLLLDLKICDPAMGSGAFLVEACRYLADQVVAAWTREGKLEDVARVAPNEDPVLHARRLVAQRCLYGVDRNDSAVELTKLSLWLVTLAKDLPFTFVDHALRHGDSLVGLSFDQIRRGHWRTDDGKGGDKSKQLSFTERALQEALDEAIQIRQHILDLATDASPEAQREKERLVADAADASDRARLIADVIVGAFFAETKDKAREQERIRRLALVERWLAGEDDVAPELRALQQEIRARLPVFHWMLEYPEVFYAERPDPLEGGKVNRAAFMDAFVGNPPFAGKNGITESGGEGYLEWFQAVHVGAHGNADLSAHFFRRAATLLGAHGTIGLIATNTIAQGDTRSTGLQFLACRAELESHASAPLRLCVSNSDTRDGGSSTEPVLPTSEVSRRGAEAQRGETNGEGAFVIYDATSSMMWPGEAAVSVSVVHLACGRPAVFVGEPRLDGARVRRINSRLRVGAERDDPSKLHANDLLAFVGTNVFGTGFVLAPEEAQQLIRSHPPNEERVRRYLGGQEVNASPDHSASRFVISFEQMTLESAAQWPVLLEVVAARVKPERERLRGNADAEKRRKHWWLFGRWTQTLYDSLAHIDLCLVTSSISKHRVFARVPSDAIFSHNLTVFAVSSAGFAGVLQSRIHVPWADLHSSGLEDRSGYRPSDCFETFPFPEPDPRAVIPTLEDVGARLYDTRAAYMIETQQGLTQTYNRLKDPECHDPEIVTLRRLHEEMDRAVLDAYGWTDLEVPPYCPTTPAEHQALERFKDEIIDRLFVLNAERAAEEAKSAPKKPAKGAKNPAKKSKGKKASPQASLDLDDEG
ncbi:MAG: N-6 DNA methylase [Myxococcales bacterium]|nr:N-6 DNA methylase [Myxococcales bacterium]